MERKKKMIEANKAQGNDKRKVNNFPSELVFFFRVLELLQGICARTGYVVRAVAARRPLRAVATWHKYSRPSPSPLPHTRIHGRPPTARWSVCVQSRLPAEWSLSLPRTRMHGRLLPPRNVDPFVRP